MATRTTRTASPGRPREGRDGMRVADYPRVSIYMDPERHDRLRALSELLGRSASNLVEEAFDKYLVNLSAAQRQALEAVLEAKKSVQGA